MINRALNTLESGRVMRYHAAPTVTPQMLGHHAWGVAVIALYLTGGNPSAELLKACILHDAAELFTGDVPFSVKRDNLEAKAMYELLEAQAHANLVMELPDLTSSDQAILKLADTLEGLIWCYKNEREGPVTHRWLHALKAGLEKFTQVLPQDILDRAMLLAMKPRTK